MFCSKHQSRSCNASPELQPTNLGHGIALFHISGGWYSGRNLSIYIYISFCRRYDFSGIGSRLFILFSRFLFYFGNFIRIFLPSRSVVNEVLKRSHFFTPETLTSFLKWEKRQSFASQYTQMFYLQENIDVLRYRIE